MEHRRIWLLDESGRPLSPHIEQALVSLVPKFQRHFPAFRDEPSLIDVLEEAGRKIDRREKRSGRIERLHPYAWVTLRNVATSRLRRGDGRLTQLTLASEESEAALEATPARAGGPEEIERRILLGQVFETLTPEERLVCVLKKAGFSSREIAARRGGTAAAINIMLWRVRRKVRRLLGVQLGSKRRAASAGKPADNGAERASSPEADVENHAGE
ncbi:MAG TPA: hypothetical protein VES67_19995 [Vicinamibacterales bacterium]|nr:hypothetical protein [Vicinamibacterales bacterium]